MARKAKPDTAVETVVSAQDRDNPEKLSGEALRTLAHKMGLSRSSLPGMSDEKIREQCKYITYRQYSDAVG